MSSRPLKPVETEAVPLREVVSAAQAELLAGHGVSLGLARLRDGRWVAAVPLVQGLRFKGRPDRDAAIAAAAGPLRALARSLAAASKVAPPSAGSLESEQAAYVAARGVAEEIPERSQGLPAGLSAQVIERCPRGRTFRSDADISRYVDDLIGTSWWRRRYPHVQAVRVLRAAERNRSMEEEYAGLMTMRIRRDDTVGWDLSIREEWRYELVVLHELAHAMVPPRAGFDDHGPEWLRAWIDLVARQLGEPIGEHLAWLAAQYGRIPATDAEMAEALRLIRVVVKDLAKMRRLNRTFADTMKSWRWRFTDEVVTRGRAQRIWGERQIVSACRRAGDKTVTMAKLTDLRAVTPQGSRRPPADVDARRVARRALVVLGSSDEALSGLGLSPKACRFSEGDLAWEAAHRLPRRAPVAT